MLACRLSEELVAIAPDRDRERESKYLLADESLELRMCGRRLGARHAIGVHLRARAVSLIARVDELSSTREGLVAAWIGGTRERHPDVGIWVSPRETSLEN